MTRLRFPSHKSVFFAGKDVYLLNITGIKSIKFSIRDKLIDNRKLFLFPSCIDIIGNQQKVEKVFNVLGSVRFFVFFFKYHVVKHLNNEKLEIVTVNKFMESIMERIFK